MKRLMRNIALLHRYVGLVGSGCFAVWFVSGIFMLYVEMPYFRQSAVAYAGDPPLDLAAVRLGPGQAVARAGMLEAPERIRLAMLLDRPVYRILPAGQASMLTVYADDGRILPPLTEREARKIAADFHHRLSGAAANTGNTAKHREIWNSAVKLVSVDQWTLYKNDFAPQRPFYRFYPDDADGTELYVSKITGQVAQRTTRGDRILAWAGPVLHWIYFAALRQHAGLWSTTVLWISGGGMVVAFSGLLLGLWRLRSTRKRQFSSPFREGWLRWHHWLGLIFGLVTCTWIFSGWMSMTPLDWAPGTGATRAESRALRGGALRTEAFDSHPLFQDLIAAARSQATRANVVREIEFIQLAGRPHLRIVQDNPRAPGTTVSKLRPAPGPPALCASADALRPAALRTECVILEEWDPYYFAKPGTRFRMRPLPVIRVSFDDPERHSYYIDPASARIVARYETSSRWNRWLYHGLHSFSLPALYQNRPLWDILMLVLLAGGLALSLTSIVLTVRKLK